MRHFLFETKEYKYKVYFKRRRKEQDSMMLLARLLRSFNRTGRSKGSKSFVKASRFDSRQKCVVKMQYSNSMKAHHKQLEEYLVREGTDIDGGRAKLYGTNLQEYNKNMVDKNFRIFLSPQSDKIDLKKLTEKFIKTLEQQTGYSFYWQAANHYNTAHPHAHLLINGKDKTGKEVDIPRDIVKTFMREYARDICTSQLGCRTKKEIEFERSKEPETRRFTRLDESVRNLCGEGFTINKNTIRENRERILARLENLCNMGLCSFNDGSYNLSPQWEESLRANSRYNTFLTARSQLKYSNQASLKIFSGEHGTVTGKVTNIFRPEDDFSNNHAVIIECPDGKSFFVPLLKKPELHSNKIKMGLMEGDLVSIKTYENQRGRLTPVIFKNDVKGSNRSFAPEINNNRTRVKK
jgi:hypothetical protein